MTPEELSNLINNAVESLITAQKIEKIEIPEIKIERPKSKDHGDFASNIALALSKPIRSYFLSLSIYKVWYRYFS